MIIKTNNQHDFNKFFSYSRLGRVEFLPRVMMIIIGIMYNNGMRLQHNHSQSLEYATTTTTEH